MGKACLLIVEDHLDMLELMRLVLSEEGFYVAVAADGKKAIELLEHFRPGVLITDIHLPGINGIDVIRHVRKTFPLQSIPIIAMSADYEDGLASAEAAGANVTLKKPLDLDEVVEVVKNFVPNRKPMTSSEAE
jgi:two-component system chemotaxis response regulator CheY